MKQVNILEARNSLSRLVAVASAGEEVVIAKRGVPVARLVSADRTATPVMSAGRAALWLMTHPVPQHSVRSADSLDAQIVAEREGWE